MKEKSAAASRSVMRDLRNSGKKKKRQVIPRNGLCRLRVVPHPTISRLVLHIQVIGILLGILALAFTIIKCKWLARGLEKFVSAVAFYLCLNLPAADWPGMTTGGWRASPSCLYRLGHSG